MRQPVIGVWDLTIGYSVIVLAAWGLIDLVRMLL